jgi:hypothetical protein
VSGASTDTGESLLAAIERLRAARRRLREPGPLTQAEHDELAEAKRVFMLAANAYIAAAGLDA